MPANSPEEICDLFKRYMADGDLESVLTLYDADAVFLNEAGEPAKGGRLKAELAVLASARTAFEFKIRKVVRADDVALMHTDWEMSSLRRMSVRAVEVARRQKDGTWRWLIGDPFTVGKRLESDY